MPRGINKGGAVNLAKRARGMVSLDVTFACMRLLYGSSPAFMTGRALQRVYEPSDLFSGI